MIFKVRRSYNAPAVYLLGGGELEGLDTAGGQKPAERAEKLDNLWREADGCVCKRPGIGILERCDISGRVEWMTEHLGVQYYFYIGEQGGVLRRRKNGKIEERPAKNARKIKMGDRLFIFCKGEWIVADGKHTRLLTAEGSAVLDGNFAAVAVPWSISSTDATLPLTHAGGRPGRKGQGVLPPNLLIPLVRESFVYTASDKEAGYNRFNLSFVPQIKGRLPTNSDGTHADLNAEDSAIRVATLSASAQLEVRLEKTDAYGNTTSYWSRRSWRATDNINAEEAAVWINGIHKAELSFDGDDNIRITYFRPVDNKTAALFDAGTFALFGVGGLKDRIFAASGDRIYYSGMDDGLYFGSLQYLDFGEEILLMGGEESVLTALSASGAWRIKGQAEREAGEYALDAFFTVSARFPSPKPFGSECIVAGNELLFYSERGVCAVAPSGVLDERNVQVRSGRIQGLLETEDPAAIHMGVWQDKLFLAGEKGVYLLDLSRRVKAENDPYSSHGYEAYFWSITGVDCFVSGKQLCLFKDGQLYTLKTDVFYDEMLVNGQLIQSPVSAVWETPVLGDGMRCGTFCGLLLCVDGPTVLRISVWDERGRWRSLYDYDGSLLPYRYAPLHYNLFCYGARLRNTLRRRLMLRHRRGLRLKFENDISNSALRLRNFALEYK